MPMTAEFEVLYVGTEAQITIQNGTISMSEVRTIIIASKNQPPLA